MAAKSFAAPKAPLDKLICSEERLAIAIDGVL
jgi:hypothetical protein